MNVLLVMAKLLSIAVVFQSVELFQIRRAWSAGGIWDWNTLRKEFGILGVVFDEHGFTALLCVRLVCAFVAFFFPNFILMLVLFLSTLLIAVRWRGSFNGGSDYMTLIVSGCLSVAWGFPRAEKACLYYVAVQTCLSYFMAGMAKIRKKDWWTGKALSDFLKSEYYDVPERLRSLTKQRSLLVAVSWMILTFECVFPLSLCKPEICAIFIAFALVFHLGNVYAFGLNRFLFAWAAAYPALYFCSSAVWGH